MVATILEYNCAEQAQTRRVARFQQATPEIAMADDKSKRAPHGGKLINLTERYEIVYWTKKFGVRRECLAEAVKAVGPSADKVGEYLKR
jgi:hypothetical protein